MRLLLYAAILTLGTACSKPPAAPTGDIWFAGIIENGDLRPGTAVIDGKRWEGFSNSDVDELPQSLDAIPSEWLPAGRKFPRTWQAYLFNGKKPSIEATGIKRDGYGAPQVITTDLTRATLSSMAQDLFPQPYVPGIAVVGEAIVRLFHSMTAEQKNKVMPLLESALWEAETKAISNPTGDAEIDPEIFTDAFRHRPRKLRVIHAVTVTETDGGNTYFLELEKEYGEPKDCPARARFGATLISNGNSVKLATIAAQFVCEKFASRVPLAVVERGGVRCWLAFEAGYEGYQFILARPNQWVTEPFDTCNLK
jgi:hypothetical protein